MESGLVGLIAEVDISQHNTSKEQAANDEGEVVAVRLVAVASYIPVWS